MSRSATRYAFLSFHIVVWLALLIVACLAASLLGLIMVICSGIALLVYVPATLVISSKNSDSRFDSSAGEVGYLSVQMLVNILFILGNSLSLSSSGLCYRFARAANYYNTVCGLVLAGIVIAAIQLVLMLAWMCFIIVVTRNHPTLRPREAFKQPAHRVVNGGSSYPSSQPMATGQTMGTQPYMMEPKRTRETAQSAV